MYNNECICIYKNKIIIYCKILLFLYMYFLVEVDVVKFMDFGLEGYLLVFSSKDKIVRIWSSFRGR